jgi:hypothetical protein
MNAAISATRFSLLITFPAAFSASIAIVQFGKSMQMERGCWQGLTPPWMGRQVEVTTTKSEGGSLLGRSVRRLGVAFSMDFDYLTDAFMRSSWMPFMIAAETAPFFVIWNPLDYPTEVAFCWVEDPSKDFKAPTFSSRSLMTCGVKMKGKTA